MEPSIGKSRLVTFEKAENNAYKSLQQLAGYRKRHSPGFSEVASMLALLEEQKKTYEEQEVRKRLQALLEHSSRYLMDEAATEGDWDGAPREVLERARQTWTDYCVQIRLLANQDT